MPGDTYLQMSYHRHGVATFLASMTSGGGHMCIRVDIPLESSIMTLLVALVSSIFAKCPGPEPRSRIESNFRVISCTLQLTYSIQGGSIRIHTSNRSIILSAISSRT